MDQLEVVMLTILTEELTLPAKEPPVMFYLCTVSVQTTISFRKQTKFTIAEIKDRIGIALKQILHKSCIRFV